MIVNMWKPASGPVCDPLKSLGIAMNRGCHWSELDADLEARFVGSDRAFIFFRLIFIAGDLIFDDFAYSNRKPLEAGAGNQYNGNRERMMNSMILLKNGCVHNGRGQVSTTDLLIDGGKIVKIGEHLGSLRRRRNGCCRDACVSRLY